MSCRGDACGGGGFFQGIGDGQDAVGGIEGPRDFWGDAREFGEDVDVGAEGSNAVAASQA